MAFCTDPPAMISEFCDDGNLTDYLERKKWSTDLSLQMLSEASQGMMFLHSHKVIHGDLKPANILVNQGVAKIADFGLSKFRQSTSYNGATTVRGTHGYMAPEVYSGLIEKPADVYAFAMVMYEVMGKGTVPFAESWDAQVRLLF